MNNHDAIYPLSSHALTELLRAVGTRGGVFRFQAGGDSMHPAIQEGDHVLVAPICGRPLARGEVVAFCRPGTEDVVVHRILRVGCGYLFIKGDNVSLPDGMIPSSNLLGVVIGVQRQGHTVYWPDRRRWGMLAQAFFAGYLTLHDSRRFLRRIYPALRRRLRSRISPIGKRAA